MEDIRFYDWEFNLLHIESNYISANWDIYYNKIGSFEGHFAQNADLVDALMTGDYIIAVQGEKQAIVTGRQLSSSELILYGKTLNWILTRRVCEKFNTSEWTEGRDIESIARYIVGQGFSDVLQSEVMELGERIGFPTDEQYFFWRNTVNVCSDVIIDCLDDKQAGHKVVYDTKRKRWIFQILRGTVRDIVISESNHNAYNLQYSRDVQSFYTDGMYEYTPETENSETGGQATSQPEIHEIDGGTGKLGLYKWVAKLNGQNNSEARSDLKTKKVDEITTAKMYNLRWGVDYNLGDTVRLQLEFGVWHKTVQKRITGVHIWYENNNEGEEPVFEEE